jgi:hypothetical protein
MLREGRAVSTLVSSGWITAKADAQRPDSFAHLIKLVALRVVRQARLLGSGSVRD